MEGSSSLVEISTAPNTEARYQDRLYRVLDRYRVVLNNIQDVVGVHYLSGEYAWVSTSSFRVLGYAPEEMVGKNTHDFVNPEDYATMRDTGHPLPKDGMDTRMRYRFKHKKGHWIWVETITTPIYNGRPEPIATQSHTRDITPLVERERDLQEALAHEAAIRQNAVVPWAVFDLNGTFTNANGAWCSMVGYTCEELRERTFLDITHPDYIDDDVAAMDDLLSGVVGSVEMSKIFLTKEGQPVPVYIWGGVTRAPSGEPVSMFAQAQSVARITQLTDALNLKSDA